MFLIGLAAALTLAAPVESLSAVPPPPQPIYGGTPVAPGSWPAVVSINIGSFLCTGTLVTPNVIFTAAHCLDDGPDVGTIIVRRGDDVNFPVTPIKAVAYGAHPEFCGEESCKEDIHDYGYVVLATPQNDITEFPRVVQDQDEWDQLMAINSPITVVGYGQNEGDIAGIKRQVDVPITRFSSSGLEFQAGGMGLDSCYGDSGGPAFAKLASGEWVLVGITSRGYTCGNGGFYAVPLGGLCWLQESSGLDLRPADCDACDCINTDPDRDEGCGCSTAPAPTGALALLGLLAVRRRRRLAR
jgi:MYXO-CTERM domain-containing protein